MTEIKEENERTQRERKKDWDSKEGEEISDIKMTKDRNKNDLQLVWIKLCPLQWHCQLLSNMCRACCSELERGQSPARSTSAVRKRRSSLRQPWVASFPQQEESQTAGTTCTQWQNVNETLASLAGQRSQSEGNNNTLCTMLCKMLMLNDSTGLLFSTDTCYRTVIEHFISAQLHQD